MSVRWADTNAERAARSPRRSVSLAPSVVGERGDVTIGAARGVWHRLVALVGRKPHLPVDQGHLSADGRAPHLLALERVVKRIA